MQAQTAWVIKASKFCNMRCSYCYEWDELDRPDRIDLALWSKIFAGIRDLRDLHRQQNVDASALIVLHGGEPLILPVEYLREVTRLKDSILGKDDGGTRIVVQTNALSVTDSVLSWLIESGVTVGVSHDVRPGVRQSIAGLGVEQKVEANLERLRAAGVCSSGIVVLAAHTAPAICEIYDWYATRGLGLRVLPLFDGPQGRPGGTYELPNDGVAAALCQLFEHWITTGARIEVEPFPEYLRFVAAKIIGISARRYDRGIDGDRILLVNTNGDLYHVPDAYKSGLALGNLGRESIDAILTGDPYWASVKRERERVQRFCTGCEYSQTCGGLPLQQEMSSSPYSGKCPVVYNLLAHIEQYLRAEGFGHEELARLLAPPKS